MTTLPWIERQTEATKSLLGQGSEALRQDNLDLAQAAITEAAIILDMSPIENDGPTNELRARAFNELGVVYQRRGDVQASLNFHNQAAALCRVIIEQGNEDFLSNSAATHLNFASVALSVEHSRQHAKPQTSPSARWTRSLTMATRARSAWPGSVPNVRRA